MLHWPHSMVLSQDKTRERTQLGGHIGSSWGGYVWGADEECQDIVSEIITDKDSSMNSIYCKHFPEGTITYCANHCAKTMHKDLLKIKSNKCQVAKWNIFDTISSVIFFSAKQTTWGSASVCLSLFWVVAKQPWTISFQLTEFKVQMILTRPLQRGSWTSTHTIVWTTTPLPGATMKK